MQWILLMTLFNAEGKAIETMQIKGIKTEQECNRLAIEKPFEIINLRHEVLSIKPVCKAVENPQGSALPSLSAEPTLRRLASNRG